MHEIFGLLFEYAFQSITKPRDAHATVSKSELILIMIFTYIVIT